MKINAVAVEYIESGTFVGGEEDVFNAKIKNGEECVVLKKKDYEMLLDFKWTYEDLCQ